MSAIYFKNLISVKKMAPKLIYSNSEYIYKCIFIIFFFFITLKYVNKIIEIEKEIDIFFYSKYL